MSECINYSRCRFFVENLKNSPSTSAMIQSTYCKNKFTECARYMIFDSLDESFIPYDLFPSETEIAENIIANHH